MTEQEISIDNGNYVEQLWDVDLKRIQFRDPRLADFPERFRSFIKEEGSRMEELLERVIVETYERYDEEEVPDILKSYIMGVVCHANNESGPHYRKKELNPDGLPYPYAKHFTDMYLDGINEVYREAINNVKRDHNNVKPIGIKPTLAKVIPLHDVVEDVTMTIDGQVTGADEWKEIITHEFTDGADVAHRVVAVTKYPEHEIEPVRQVYEESALYHTIAESIVMAYIRRGEYPKLQDDPAVLKKYKEHILKAVSSMARIFIDPLEYEEDPEKYIDTVVDCLYIKCLDTLQNLQSPGMSDAILLRGRLLANIARIMGWQRGSNELMKQLGERINTDDIDDPWMVNLANQELAASLDETTKSLYEHHVVQYMRDLFGIDVQASAGFRVSFKDEEIQGQTSADPIPQITVRCSQEDLDRFRETSVTGMVNHEELRTFLGARSDLQWGRMRGALHRMIRIFGRDGIMGCIYEKGEEQEDIHPLLYIRMMVDEPPLYNRVFRHEGKPEKSPEDGFIVPNYAYTDNRLPQVLDDLAMLMDPNILKNDIHAKGCVIVFNDHYLMFDRNESIQSVCERNGIILQGKKIKHIMNDIDVSLTIPAVDNLPVEDDLLSEIPIFYIE
jgi:hypothetical protein